MVKSKRSTGFEGPTGKKRSRHSIYLKMLDDVVPERKVFLRKGTLLRQRIMKSPIGQET